jgi:broad specificity phosphatase PhoE
LNDQWYLTTIRHGETDYNREKRYAGSIDVPLNEAGKKDVSETAPFIRSMKFEVALTSPLRRAIETAHILTEGSIEIIISPYAKERNYGILEGRAFADVEHIRPPIHFIKVGGDYHSLDPPHAETFEDLRARAEVFYDEIVSQYRGKRILVVSHGVFLQQFHGLLRGKDWIESLGTPVGNLELTTFQFEAERMISEERMHLTKRKQANF